MSRTITFYKLISPYIEDITKNCSLFGNEIDDNFMNLKELSIDSVELSGTTIIIKRIGNEQLTVDLSEIIPDEPTMSVSYDEKLGKIQIDFNKETFIIDGLLNQVNSTKLFLKKVAADLTLTGNGTIQNPLTINLTHKTGMYEPAIEFLDLTSGDTLPTSGMSIGDSYVTKEVRNPFGYLYNLEGINEIKQALLAENSEWRVPTKEDWDIMLNALECDEFKNHNYTEVSVIFGKDAGKILKSREYWQESNETNAGNDTYLFSSIPSGYGDDTKLITHAYEWGEYWTDTESSDFEHYTKQFRFDETGVYQLSRNINDYFSLRLVKTYNGENLVEYEKINNAIVKTDLMPSDSGETRLVWTMEDLNFGEDNYGGLRTPLLDEITETDLFYNVWNGNIWLKRKMKEGETTVILTDSGDTSYNIYMVVNHDFIKTDLSAMDNLIQTKQEKLIAGENIVISGNVISADLNDYLKTEDASNTYETIANVNSLSDIVSGNTGDIESLEANKANTLHTHIKSEVGLSNVDNTSDLTKPISTATQTALNSKADKATTLSEYGITDAEPAITKLTAFNKDFGTIAGTVSEGNHEHTFASITSKPNTLSGYGITDVPSDDKIYGRQNGEWSEIDTSGGGGGSTISITWSNLKSLRDAGTLVPGQSYRITDYVCTTTTTDSQAVNNLFDIVVTALDEGHLSENASATYHEGDTYFSSNNAKLESWKLKYCIDNDTSRFEWADTTNGKGVIYYMKDEWSNECPYDFKNIQFKKSNVFLYTFGGTLDNSLTGGCHHNTMMDYKSSSVLKLNFNTFGNYCSRNTFGVNCYYNNFGDVCQFNTFDNYCGSNTFGYGCGSNTFGNYCGGNTFGNDFTSNTFGYGCGSNRFGNGCYFNTFGNYCYSNRFYTGTSGTTKKDFIRYIVLEDECGNNNFYSTLTTSDTSYLQRIRIKGLGNTATTDIQITLSEVNTKYEWVICYTSGNVLKQYCPDDL